MFPYPIAKPQKCDIQTFIGSQKSGSSNQNAKAWNKPVGVSHVYMLLIGAGGNADTGSGYGGGSGSVTAWYGAAQHVPDSLLVVCGGGQSQDTFISYRGNSLVPILSAPASTGAAGAAGSVATPFAASGFFNSKQGQDGGASGVPIDPSTTIFLSGGANNGQAVNANYGYGTNNGSVTSNTASGFFQLQPIIVGVGGVGGGNGGIGCGGGYYSAGSGVGGPGMVLIASW